MTPISTGRRTVPFPVRAGLLALVLSPFMAVPALAQQIVIGGGAGATCYNHALFGRYDAVALDDCTKALRVGLPTRRDLSATYVNRAIIRIYREEYDLALEDIEESLKRRVFAEAYATRGVAYHYLGRFDEAVEQATVALEAGDLDEPEKVYYNRAVSLERLDRIEDAYNDYMRAAEIAPDWDLPRQELTRFVVVEEPVPGS